MLTVDVLEDFISALELNGDVNSSSNDGTDTTLNVNKTYHVRAGMTIEVDAAEYQVVSVVLDTSIAVSGVIIDPVAFAVPPPFFFHGTPSSINNQINGEEEDNKIPMIYLYEILREKDFNINSNIKRDADLRLFFLDNANFSDWTTDDHYSKRVEGLNSLVDEFIEQIGVFKKFYLFETDFTRINHIKWGLFKDNKGYEKRIFDDDLTGVELSFTLRIKRCGC